tara:strand:- start:275 stop:493 length:219 start_codon:yes stop_codon:yes gene_type:complete
VNPEIPIWILLPSPVTNIDTRPIVATVVTKMKNFGHIFLIDLPKSSISRDLNKDGAIIDVWRTIMPTIAPGK